MPPTPICAVTSYGPRRVPEASAMAAFKGHYKVPSPRRSVAKKRRRDFQIARSVQKPLRDFREPKHVWMAESTVMARGMLSGMIREIAPQFFTTDLPATLTYYRDKLGFECLGTWQDP